MNLKSWKDLKSKLMSLKQCLKKNPLILYYQTLKMINLKVSRTSKFQARKTKKIKKPILQLIV